jgi:hypothetical protein
MEQLELLEKLLKGIGIEPIEVYEDTDVSDAGIDIDGVYSVQLALYEPKHYFLNKWVPIEGSPVGGQSNVGNYSTEQETFDAFVEDKKNGTIA